MRKELTVRGIIIGIIITLVFTAANVYFGLKAGLTFSTSIPGAVISMAILRACRDATVQETNIVPTVASAAGTLSSIIFALPGFIMIACWTGFPFWISFAFLASGHLVGLSVGIAMLIGTLIGWGWGVPHYSSLVPDLTSSAAALAQNTWSHKVRFIGAGAIGVSAVWTLLKLVKPVARGLAGAMAASRARKAGKADTLPITERDIPIGIVGLSTLACMLPIGWLLGYFGNASGLGAHVTMLIIGGVAYVVLMSFFVSAVCGYMAGLIGSSNSPLSGIGILVVIGAALLLVLGIKPYVSPDAGKGLMAFALFTTAVIFNVAAIANNNLQDLKTGQLVDATPWKQQVALVIGVIAGAFVIPPVLDLVNHAYGFVGAPGAELRPHPLPAPQAGLISSLAQGVIAADIDWSLIRIGGLIGVGIILLDEILARTTKHMRIPPLAVGLGIYLPTQSTLMIVVGAIAGWFFDQRANRTLKPEATKQLGVLLASGLIVGESIIGVLLSAVVVFSGKAAPLALVGPGFETAGIIVGGVAFAVIAFVLYRWVLRVGSARST